MNDSLPPTRSRTRTFPTQISDVHASNVRPHDHSFLETINRLPDIKSLVKMTE